VELVRRPGALGPVATRLRVVEVDVADAEIFGKTLSAAYGMSEGLAPWSAALVGRPGWRCYLACDGEVPVGTAALHLMRGGIAWLGAAATLPTQRRRGAQRALIARRIADASGAGATLLVSETAAAPDNPSLRNLLAAGFRITRSAG
jgi:hypothetical protein